MKTKILSVVTASMLLVSAANASQSFISAGYASVDMDGVSSSGVSMDVGAKFGKTWKQKIGTKFVFIGTNDDSSSDQGHVGEVYYSLGYEVLYSTILAVQAGMGFQSLGTVGSGSNSTSAYAVGLSYGATLLYEISDSFDIGTSYTKNDLSFDGVDYKVDVIEASLSYKF
jgi:hypothetical protein